MAAPKIHIVREAPTQAPTTATAVERYQHGWRSGKPVEDPEKLKRWGFIGAKPSEYLVCTRRGQIDRKRSGQGMRIFKWPWHSVAIVPTTLQRIEFTADQITRERVGVAVTGIAVYRIAEPMLAFRVLNFTFPEAAAEKLAETLREMFVGSARRLIANLSLDECLTRRKETIAGYLMEEIAPVVGGEGSPDDTTTKGWGVVIDTIEIQQVQIQSPQVFGHLQAPYRAEIAARAEQAQLEHTRATRALKARTEAEATEVEAREAARRAEMNAAGARRSAELERDRIVQAIQLAEEQRRTKASADVAAMEAERVRAEAAQQSAILDAEHQRLLEHAKQDAEHERARKQAELALEMRRREAEAKEQESVLDAAQQRRLAEIEQMVAQTRTLHKLVTHGLPEIARALQHSVGTMHYTQIGGDAQGSPLAAVPAAFAQLLALARSFGLQLPKE
jgi:flotillin